MPLSVIPRILVKVLSYFAEMQLAYSTAPANRAACTLSRLISIPLLTIEEIEPYPNPSNLVGMCNLQDSYP